VKNERVVVVGAGIAGLAAAFTLQRAGCEVVVLEQTQQVGGRMQTLQKNEFRIDTGATILLSSFTEMLKLIGDANLADQIQPASDLGAVLRAGTIHRMRATSSMDAVRTSLLSWSAKAQLGRLLLQSRRLRHVLDDWSDLSAAAPYDEESAKSFADRRLSNEVLDYVIEPALGAALLSVGEEVSIVDLLFIDRHYLGKAYFNSSEGMGFLPTGLAAALDVRLGAEVRSVEMTSEGVEVIWSSRAGEERTERASACVVAVPAPIAAKVCLGLGASARQALQDIRYVRSVGVHIGLSTTPADKAIWVAVPRSEDPSLVGVMFDHNKAAGRAPKGKGLISSYWLPAWSDDLDDSDDETVLSRALPSLDRVVPGIESSVETLHVQRWQYGLSVNGVGHHRARALLERADTSTRLQLAGDYFGVASTNTSLTSGVRCAERLLSSFS
jgi:oxygen-dependent protoporphyrinogen oxidase